MASRDDDVKQALGQVAKLGGFQIKRMATTDDLKDHTITITIVRTSDGWHQERLAFEEQSQVVATVNNNGEVEKLEVLDPSDLTEKDETQGAADPDEAIAAEAAAAQSSEPVQEPQPETPHLVGELAAVASRRRRGMVGTD